MHTSYFVFFFFKCCAATFRIPNGVREIRTVSSLNYANDTKNERGAKKVKKKTKIIYCFNQLDAKFLIVCYFFVHKLNKLQEIIKKIIIIKIEVCFHINYLVYIFLLYNKKKIINRKSTEN